MDQELLLQGNGDVEDGELSDSSDEDVYTPLQRPTTSCSANAEMLVKGKVNQVHNATAQNKTQDALEEDFSQSELTSSSDSSDASSDVCLKKISKEGDAAQGQRKRRKGLPRTVMVRVQPTDTESQEKRARFKKYNIWMSAIHEELTENMRGCDVTRTGVNDRNVENYDYTLRNRLGGENSLKRRLSNSTDDFSDSDICSTSKRERCSSSAHEESLDAQRRSVKSRLGHRSLAHEFSSSTNDSLDPRLILDLNDTAGRDAKNIAVEIANKLYEDKDELLVRIVEILGTNIPIEIYKETQRIEASGGLMIKNGTRRRTPGGVFLFLLKNHESLTPEQHKRIFNEDQQNTHKRRKECKSISRDRKVEELKKRLSAQDIPAISKRKDTFLLGSNLNLEHQKPNLSNPPPSPVGQEQSPEYRTQGFNHITSDANLDKPSTSSVDGASHEPASKNLINYDDDFLDVNCGEMDFF